MHHQAIQGDYGLLQSFLCGRTHRDTQVFDDVAQLELDPHYSRIERIEVEYDSLVFGFIVTYNRGPGASQVVHHMGNGQGHRHKAAINLAPDEFITHVSGRHGDVFDHLKIMTNRGQVLDVGGHGGGPFDVAIPPNYTVLGFKGGLGGHVHNLALILKPILVWNPQVSARFGNQHPDTRPFDDLPLLQGANFSQITEIKAVSDGNCVLGIEVHYLVNGREPRSSGWHMGSSPAGRRIEEVLRFAGNEHVVQIEGRCGNVIDHLKIVTNRGQQLSVGGHGGSPFNIQVPPGRRVVAFGGGCNGHLHNIYVHFN